MGVSLKIFKKGVGTIPIVTKTNLATVSYIIKRKKEGRPTERPAERHRCDAVKA